mgnify:CR=1 FL=1
MASQLKVNEIIKQSGSSITIGVDGDTVSGPFTAQPLFYAYITGTQAVSNATETRVALETELFDTGSCFNTTTYRFTPNKAGYYFLVGSLQINSASDFDGWQVNIIMFIKIKLWHTQMALPIILNYLQDKIVVEV